MVPNSTALGSSVDGDPIAPPSGPGFLPSGRSFAQDWWEFERQKSGFEDDLFGFFESAGAEYDTIGADYHDNSLEIYGVTNGFRLTVEAQQFILDAGFDRCFVNHEDRWETHYTWFRDGKRGGPVAGWRVRYGHKCSPEKSGLEVEVIPPSWKQAAEWVASGYLKVVSALFGDGGAKQPSTANTDEASDMNHDSPPREHS